VPLKCSAGISVPFKSFVVPPKCSAGISVALKSFVVPLKCSDGISMALKMLCCATEMQWRYFDGIKKLCCATEIQWRYFGGIRELCCATEMAWRVIPLFLAMRLASPPIHHQHQTTPWVVHWPFAPQPQVSNSVSSLTKSQHTPSPSDDKSHRCRALGCSPRAPHFSVQNNVVPGIGPYLYQRVDVLCTLVRIPRCTWVGTL